MIKFRSDIVETIMRQKLMNKEKRKKIKIIPIAYLLAISIYNQNT